MVVTGKSRCSFKLWKGDCELTLHRVIRDAATREVKEITAQVILVGVISSPNYTWKKDVAELIAPFLEDMDTHMRWQGDDGAFGIFASENDVATF